jgi:hypothetical protein
MGRKKNRVWGWNVQLGLTAHGVKHRSPMKRGLKGVVRSKLFVTVPREAPIPMKRGLKVDVYAARIV